MINLLIVYLQFTFTYSLPNPYYTTLKTEMT